MPSAECRVPSAECRGSAQRPSLPCAACQPLARTRKVKGKGKGQQWNDPNFLSMAVSMLPISVET